MNILTKGLLIGLAIGLILGFAGGYGLNSYQAFDGGGGGGGNGGFGTGTPEELFADAMAVELAKVIYEANSDGSEERGLLNSIIPTALAQQNDPPTEKEINCYSANSESIGRAIMAAVDSRVDGLSIPAGSGTGGNGCWMIEVTGSIDGVVYRDTNKVGVKTTDVYIRLSKDTKVTLRYYDRNCRLQTVTLSVPSNGALYSVLFEGGVVSHMNRFDGTNGYTEENWERRVRIRIAAGGCKFNITLNRTLGSLDPNRCPNCQTSGGGGGINTNE